MTMPYEKFAAWKACHELVQAVYQETQAFPVEERYGLTSQARRAAFSAAVNIVEGSAKRGSKEFRRYLDISLGSLAEFSYIWRLARDIGILSENRFAKIEGVRARAGVLTWRLYKAVSRHC